jgi:hypothetical protein
VLDAQGRVRWMKWAKFVMRAFARVTQNIVASTFTAWLRRLPP